MIRKSKLINWCVIFSVLFSLGYFHMVFGSSIKSHMSLYQLLVAMLGILLSVWIKTFKRDSVLVNIVNQLDKSVWLYMGVIVVSSIYSSVKYGYGIKEVLFLVTPYLYIFYAYPLAYLYRVYGMDRILKTTFNLTIVMLMIKSAMWFLYNYLSISIFSNLLTQYGNWSRNGNIRIDVGVLFMVAFCYTLYKISSNKKSYVFPMLFMAFYVVMVTQFRFLTIVLVITIAVTYLSATPKLTTRKFSRIIIATLCAIIFISMGYLDSILQSFSVVGENAKSTLARIETVTHLFDIYKKNIILGIGMIPSDSNILARNTTANAMYQTRYYLSDIGILSSLFLFGLFVIPLLYAVVKPIVRALKSVKKEMLIDNSRVIVISMAVYFFVSTLALNIFDTQRAFNIPFLVSIMVYIGNIRKENEAV